MNDSNLALNEPPAPSSGIQGEPASDPLLFSATRQQSRRLDLLHEVSRELVSILDREALLQRVAELIKHLIDYQLFSVMLWDEEKQQLESILSVRWGGCKSKKINAGSEQGLFGAAVALKGPIRVGDVRLDPRYINCGDLDVRSELVLPLLIKGRLIGLLDFESYQKDAFDQEIEDLLMTLAANIAIALENATLYERVKADERRLDSELETAREMQRFLLPRTSPWVPGLQTAVAYCPARHLGGDLYDFLAYGEGRTAIAVGDVAGKGTSAALYGSLAIGLLRGYMSDNRCDPSCVLAYLNEELRQLKADKRFLALTFAVYDSHRRILTVANAGLPYPLLLRDGQAREIRVSGLPVGAMSAADYRHVEIELREGDVIVFTSDGISECLDHQSEPFGDRRIEQTLLELGSGSARDIASGLLTATEDFLGGRCEASDDRTVVALRVGAE